MKLGITFDLWLTLIGEIEGGSQSVSRNLLRSEITQKKLLELKENISIEVIIQVLAVYIYQLLS